MSGWELCSFDPPTCYSSGSMSPVYYGWSLRGDFDTGRLSFCLLARVKHGSPGSIATAQRAAGWVCWYFCGNGLGTTAFNPSCSIRLKIVRQRLERGSLSHIFEEKRTA